MEKNLNTQNREHTKENSVNFYKKREITLTFEKNQKSSKRKAFREKNRRRRKVKGEGELI